MRLSQSATLVLDPAAFAVDRPTCRGQQEAVDLGDSSGFGDVDHPDHVLGCIEGRLDY